MNLQEEALEVLRLARTGTQFINLFMSSEIYGLLMKEEENFDDFSEILNNLDLSYASMPKNNLKLNILLSICCDFKIYWNYLENYKTAILQGDLSSAFEYNKKGIFRQSYQEECDNFEEEIINSNGEEYFNNYIILNSNFLREIYNEEEDYPLMSLTVTNFSNKKVKNFYELFIENYNFCEESLVEIYQRTRENFFKKEDNLTFLLLFFTYNRGKINIDDFLNLANGKDLKNLRSDIEIIFNNKNLKILDSEKENFVFVKFNEEFKTKKLEKIYPLEEVKKTESKKRYIKGIVAGDNASYIELTPGLTLNSPFVASQQGKTIIDINGISSPYTFSWTCFLLSTKNYDYFLKNFDMSYLLLLIMDLKVFQSYEIAQKVMEISVSMLKFSSNLYSFEEIDWNQYYEGVEGLYLPKND